jgi:hypothetical protein
MSVAEAILIRGVLLHMGMGDFLPTTHTPTTTTAHTLHTSYNNFFITFTPSSAAVI